MKIYRSDTGQKPRALELYVRALTVYKAIGDREGQIRCFQGSANAYASLGQPALATISYKQAVNLVQTLRADIKGLEKSYQESFKKSWEDLYHELANVLIEQGRLAEAEQVLGLIKDDEYFKFIRAARAERVDLTPKEQVWQAKYEKLGEGLAANAKEFEQLKKVTSPSKQMKDRMDVLQKQMDAASEAFQVFLGQAKEAFAVASADNRLDHLQNDQLEKILKKSLPGTAAIYTLVTQDGIRSILTLPGLTELKDTKSQKIAYSELSRKILDFRAALTKPNLDPGPLGAELYDLIVRPVHEELKGSGATSVIWSLDGPLRYLPLGALYDKTTSKYCLEESTNSLFTPSTMADLGDEPFATRTGVGFGVSKPATVGTLQFLGLEAVPQELAALKENMSAPIYPDAAFTEEALNGVMNHPPSTIHLATHFQLGADNTKSFLLLGNGKPLYLDKFSKWRQGALDGVELFVLFACNTATPSGSESDGVGDGKFCTSRRGASGGSGDRLTLGGERCFHRRSYEPFLSPAESEPQAVQARCAKRSSAMVERGLAQRSGGKILKSRHHGERAGLARHL